MARIHPTAIIESNVQLCEGTSVWDNAHIRRDTVLGDECIVGGKSMIAARTAYSPGVMPAGVITSATAPRQI